MMHHVRPCRMFEKLSGDRDVLYRIPTHRGVDSETIMSLETLLMVAAIRITGSKSILEFGTCLGYNAFQLSRNTSAHIVTVDRDRKQCVFDGEPESARITTVQRDLFDVLPSPFDFVFCDINYTPETLERATKLAFACSPMAIAWHDYGHPLIPHVKPFLDDLGKTQDLFHIEDSWLVFWFREGL